MKAKIRFYNVVMFLALTLGILFIENTFIFVCAVVTIVACLYKIEVVIPTFSRDFEAKAAEKFIRDLKK